MFNPFTIIIILMFFGSAVWELIRRNWMLSIFMLLSGLINIVVPLIKR